MIHKLNNIVIVIVVMDKMNPKNVNIRFFSQKFYLINNIDKINL